jgi:Flp pilus assembly protein TadG
VLPVSALRPQAGQRAAGSGQALVEFALVAPIFFLILFGIIQMGLLFGGQNSLVNAVRETARYSAPYRVIDNSGAQDACDNLVLDKLDDALHANPLTADAARLVPHTGQSWLAEYTWEPDPAGTYYVQITVQADYKFPLYVPLIGYFLDGLDGVSDNSLRLSAKEEMRIENGPLAPPPDTPASCP